MGGKMSFFKSLFKTKLVHSDSEPQTSQNKQELHRCLTATDLTLLGIGAIIGAGIFVLTGIAATQAGPAIIFSYFLAALACGFTAFSYAELSSSLGGCGGAYGYTYAALGELLAWVVGWALLLAYGMDVVVIAIGWAAYATEGLRAVGLNIPHALANDPMHGGIVNLPAMLIILLLSGVLSMGAKESAKFNKIVVFLKLFVIVLFIVIGACYFDPTNWKPFAPFGMSGIVTGAGLIFFAYIGFDTISTAAEEAINPQRDLPISIIASLGICTLIYILVAGILTSIMYYPTLNVSSPVATALLKLGYRVSAEIIAIGAIAGLTTGILVMHYGVTRIFLAMARDGLLPARFVKIHKKSRTPRQLIWTSGIIFALSAGLLPIHRIAEIVNFGVLAAFCAVSLCVIILRRSHPNMARPFKTPLNPLFPFLGMAFCFYLMINLSLVTWLSFAIWTVIGLVIYFCYSRANVATVDESDFAVEGIE